MAKILLVSNDESTVISLQKMLSSYEVIPACDETLINDILKVENPDIVIIDCDITLEELKPLYRQIKKAHVIIMLLLGENPINKEFLNRADLFVTKLNNMVNYSFLRWEGVRRTDGRTNLLLL